MLGLFLISLVSALDNYGTFENGETIRITQVCSDATYINISSISNPKSQVMVSNIEMASAGSGEYYYEFTNTTENGRYDVRGISDGCEEEFAVYLYVNSTGNESGSMFYIILLTSLAVIFLLASLFVNEEFFVYVSGVLFLVGGIFLMVYGLDSINDTNTRYLAFVYLGIGILFSIGAYIYNLYSKEEEEY